jgi:pyruvate formate lyase activating enzyme
MVMKATILHIQRLSTEDGPGIRTTVFFKGCPLSCQWCHNPESISARPQVYWIENRCMDCQTCIKACPLGCLSSQVEGVVIDRVHCTGCGKCAEECPGNALELLGLRIDSDEMFSELVKDRAYYEKSGGGVTASGGEPTLQTEAVADLFTRLKAASIHTALDTCGQCSTRSLDKLLPVTDLVLYDLKEVDPVRHTDFTGRTNTQILNNLLYLSESLRRRFPETKLWIRTPLIPGTTASCENLLGLGSFIARNLDGILARWELCAFNNLCKDKYHRLGEPWAFAGVPLLTKDELSELEQVARRSGPNPAVIIATGATRIS